MNNKLYLASQSHSRKTLLKEAGIPFETIQQDADESQCDWGLPLQKLLESIATHKMEHVVLPMDRQEGDLIWVLTGDTMGLDCHGNVNGKPSSREDAVSMIQRYREGATTGTAICVDRKRFSKGEWVVEERVVDYASAEYIFDVPDELIEQYFADLPQYVGVEYSQVSGAVAIEGYGNRYLRKLTGSYTAVVGLPIYEVTRALTQLGFFAATNDH